MWPIYISRAIASAASCALGAYCMHVTNGETGVGWALLGIFIIWCTTVFPSKNEGEE